jgi:cytochrome P450
MTPTLPGPERLTDRWRALRRLRHQPLAFVQEMAQRYGDIVQIRATRASIIFVNHPELIHEILLTRAASFRKEDAVREALRRFDGESILVSEGQQWRQQRRLLQQGLRAESLQAYARVTTRHTRRMLQAWPSHGSLDVTGQMCSLTMKILADVVFGTQLPSAIVDSIRILLDARAAETGNAVSLGFRMPPRLSRPRDEALGQINSFLKGLIRKRRDEDRSQSDMLSMLVRESHRQARGVEQELVERQIRDETMSLINASQDTTSAALAWTFYLVAKHPSLQSRVRGEIESALDRLNANDGWEAKELPFTKTVAQESLRLYPPNWVLMIRQCIQATTVGGHQIPEGSRIYIFPYVVHRDARWFPSPEQFDPNRFADRPGEMPQKASYLPFGIGPHVCIGNSLTIMMLSRILAHALHQFRLDLATDQPEVEPEVGIVLKPKGGLRMAVARR